MASSVIAVRGLEDPQDAAERIMNIAVVAKIDSEPAIQVLPRSDAAIRILIAGSAHPSASQCRLNPTAFVAGFFPRL